MTESAPADLPSCIHAALDALGLPEDADDVALAEGRRAVFAGLCSALAEAHERPVTDGGEAWFVGPAPDPGLRDRARARLHDRIDPSTLRTVGADALVSLYEHALLWSPAPAGSKRQGKGAFYTPAAVVEGLLDDALVPVLEDAPRLSEVRVCDPACGAGAFLVAAHRRLTAALVECDGLEPDQAAGLTAKQALFGVDIDRPAVEVARFGLWLQTALPWSALGDIRGLRVGNALLGALPQDPPAPAPTSTADQLGLFAGATPTSPEEVWCRARAPKLAGSFFHWHLALPEVFSPARAPRQPDTRLAGGFDVVVGNPPFLNQLRTSSAHAKQVRALLEDRFGGHVRGYADAAAAFLLLGLDLLRPGGRCCLVLPLSFLSARDTAGARAQACARSSLDALWLSTTHVFESASVFVMASTLVRGVPSSRPVRRRRDLSFTEVPVRHVDMARLAQRPSWSHLVADLLGIPPVTLPDGCADVASLATVTADFRDQFYGLRGFVLEDDSLPDGADPDQYPPLVTTGLVDPAECRWGRRATRFDKQRWEAPRVDLARLEAEGTIGAWAQSRLVPKVLVATQTSTLEAVVDAEGVWLPSIPLISVVPHDDDDLWRLAAALVSPPLSAYAAATWLGAALSIKAIKLSAAQVRLLPLPPDQEAWDRAAMSFREAQASDDRAEPLRRCGRQMCEAYGLDDGTTSQLMDWWVTSSKL